MWMSFTGRNSGPYPAGHVPGLETMSPCAFSHRGVTRRRTICGTAVRKITCLSAMDVELSMTKSRSISLMVRFGTCSMKTLLVVGVCSTTSRRKQPVSPKTKNIENRPSEYRMEIITSDGSALFRKLRLCVIAASAEILREKLQFGERRLEFLKKPLAGEQNKKGNRSFPFLPRRSEPLFASVFRLRLRQYFRRCLGLHIPSVRRVLLGSRFVGVLDR